MIQVAELRDFIFRRSVEPGTDTKIRSEVEGSNLNPQMCAFHGRIFLLGACGMETETRVAIIGIIVENPDSVELLNGILHAYAQYIVGRMGIPYHARNVSIISVAVDAPQDVISALSGKIGKLPGIAVKTAYSNVGAKHEQ